MLKALMLRASATICLMGLVVLFPPLEVEGKFNSYKSPQSPGDTKFDPKLVPASGGVLYFELDNGISARVFTPEYLKMKTFQSSGGWEIELGDGRYLRVITDINDPAIANKGDGSFHPFHVDQVLQALGGISYPGLELPITVYVLPYPRENLPMSSTSGREVFLSPHVMEISQSSAAYIVTHEAGHVFQHRFLPPQSSAGWDQYKRIRGIEDENVFFNSAPHPYRPEEIFAEDFRGLFGDKDAVFGGNIENPELPSPLVVEGLKDFFISLGSYVPGTPIVFLSNYPNPFNPQTEINITLSDGFLRSGRRISVRIYDVMGRLVKEIYEAIPERNNLFFNWDGSNDQGERVASAMYLCVARAGDFVSVRKMLMVK